jgi:tripartite-type tricarboxylate transporter receptor subunit TctC
MDKYKTSDGARSLAKIILASGDFGRPLVFPPSVPADRLKTLREAFNKAVNDPALLAEAEKKQLEMDPTSGAEMESLAKEVMTASPDVIERMQKLLGK